jgi:hypothetical protein
MERKKTRREREWYMEEALKEVAVGGGGVRIMYSKTAASSRLGIGSRSSNRTRSGALTTKTQMQHSWYIAVVMVEVVERVIITVL